VPTITRQIIHDLPCYKINFPKRKISEKIEAADWALCFDGCEAGILLGNEVVKKL
jgi:hypothetical protein